MNECKATHRAPIKLGHTGENEAVRVAFSLLPFKETFPDGVPALLARRKGDAAAYPVPLTIEADTAYWAVTRADTEKAGFGQCELQWIVGNTLAKSDKFDFFVVKALEAGAEAPDAPSKAWFEAIQAQIGDLSKLTTKAKENLVAAINEAARTGGGSGGGTIDMRVSGGYIQYSSDGVTWENLIAVSELKGEAGPQGLKGDTGPQGPQGIPGEKGAAGASGKDGRDGYSPEANVVPINGGAKIIIKDKNGTTSTNVMNGAQGPKGAKGDPGATDLSLGITGAQIGQIAKITAVDADGKPTAWSPVDMPTGGGSITDDDVTAERAFAAAATPKSAGTNQIIPTGNTIKFIAEEDGILSVTSVSLLSYAYVNKPILASDVPMYSVSSIEAGFEIAINPDYTLGTHFANGQLAFPADIKSGKSYTLRYYSSATIYLYPIDISTFAAGSLITKATEGGAIVAHFTADKDYTGIRFCVSISRGETATITKITLAEGDAPAEYNPDSNSKQVAVQAGKTYYLSDVKAKSVAGPGTFYQAPEAVLSINGLVPDNGAIKTYGTTKEFACFGDSIWAFGASTGGIGSVSDYMQALCGGIWHNLSTGGSTMATRPGTYAGAYDAFDFHALADCVASGDFSAPKAVDGATTNIANADDVSWADVDAVMIAYGTNDIAFGGTLDNDSDLYDKATVCGALRYGIKTIAAAYPTITFYVLGILYRSADSVDVKTISAWNEGLRKAAEMMGAEYVPMIGINAGNSSTYLYDGTHPNAAGKMAIAKSIARRIINL